MRLCNIFTLKLQNTQDRVAPIKRRFKNATDCFHGSVVHTFDQDFVSPGSKGIVQWQMQQPRDTGIHTILANKTRKQSASPPKPSTINPHLFSLIYMTSFHKHWSTIVLALHTLPYSCSKFLHSLFGP